MAFKGHQLEAYHDFVVDQADEESEIVSTSRPTDDDGAGEGRLAPVLGSEAWCESLGFAELPRQAQLDLGDDAGGGAAETQPSEAAVRQPNDPGMGRSSRLRSRRARPSRTRRAIDESSHLVAARRLSKAIRRAPNRAEEARIGRLVCGHLIALLKETDHELSANAQARQ